jgi:cytochrome P450
MTIDRALPLAPRALPLLGHALPLVRDPLGFVASLPAHGDLVRFQLGPQSVVMVCDPALVRQVLLDDRTFDKGGPLYDRARETFGDGLVTCPHAAHRRQRRLCQPAFHPSRLPAYAQAMADSAHATVASWHDGQIIDATTEMTGLTVRCAVQTMFATALTPQATRHAYDDATTILGGIFWRTITPAPLLRLPLPANRRYQRAQTRLRHTAAGIIAARRAEGADHGDLLSAFLTATDPDSPRPTATFSDEELIDQVVTFFGTGSETTAHTLAWALYLLARHPEVERRVHAEVDHVLAGAPAAHAHVSALDLTARVITETLRLYPPGWLATRTVTRDTELAGIPMPAGTTLAYSPYLLHHRADLHEEADRFDPDRWSGTQPDRAAYLPFGAGARKCIGEAFALTEAVLSLATVVSGWRVHPLTTRLARPVVRAGLSPRGLRLRVTAR